MILVKELALVDKHANTPLSTLKMRSLPFLRANMPLYDLLRLFETGRCHMAVLSEAHEAKGGLASFEGPLTPLHPATPEALPGHELEDLHPLVALEQDQVIQNQVRSTRFRLLGGLPHGIKGESRLLRGLPHGLGGIKAAAGVATWYWGGSRLPRGLPHGVGEIQGCCRVCCGCCCL